MAAPRRRPRAPVDVPAPSGAPWQVRLYCCNGLCHAVLFEGPLAAVEGLVRGVCCLLFGLLMLVLAVLSQESAKRAVAASWLREGCLFLAAAVTLSVPCAAVTVYRDFWTSGLDGRLSDSYEDDWVLAPLPSLLGSVDSRRFRIFTRGQGAYAANVRSGQWPLDSADSWRGTNGYARVGQHQPRALELAVHPDPEPEGEAGQERSIAT